MHVQEIRENPHELRPGRPLNGMMNPAMRLFRAVRKTLSDEAGYRPVEERAE